MPNLLLVMLGGAIGAGLRHLAGGVALARLGPGFPWGTLFVNLAGGLLIGLLTGWFVRAGANEAMRLFLAVGILGGFTTFSAFAYEGSFLLRRTLFNAATLYITLSVIGGLVAVWFGMKCVGLLWPGHH